MKLNDGEQVLKEDGSARYSKGKLNVSPGKLVLTNQRLGFERNNPVAAAFGLLGMLLLSPILPRKLVVDLPLGEIASFARGKYGINQNVVVVTTREGQEYRFIVSKFDAWTPVLAQARIPQAQPVV
jgi:hypothetical protein